MGMRLRPMGEMGLKTERTERARCWKCHTGFEVACTVTRAACPECGSQVALHRLNMPVMPCGGGEEQVVRLPAAGAKGSREVRPQPRPRQLSVLKNREDIVVLREIGATEEEIEDGDGDGDGDGERRAPFEPRSRIEERRQEMFSEAAPRMEGVRDSLVFQGITFKTLIVSIGFATLLLVAVAFVVGGR